MLEPLPKPRKRIGPAKRMTLISAFRCKDHEARDSFVVCADSQETTGDYRFYLSKLEPLKTGNFEIVIGGSGPADLVDAFQLRLEELLPHSSAKNISELKTIIEAELLDFIKIEVTAFAAPKREKYVRFVIAAYAPHAQECGCWITRSSRLKPVQTFELIGYDAPFYRYVAKRLYRTSAGIGQIVRVCLNLFMIVKTTSNYVGGPTTMIVIRRNGVSQENETFIQEAEEHLEELNAATDVLSLALPDTGLSAVAFEAQLQEFLASVREIRKKYVRREGQRIYDTITHGKVYEEKYAKFPEGGTIVSQVLNGDILGPPVIDDDPDKGCYVGGFTGYLDGPYVSGNTAIRLCGRKRLVGNRVFAQVVQCKQKTPHTNAETCISDNWLESLEANYTE
jgi:hypothetical protein